MDDDDEKASRERSWLWFCATHCARLTDTDPQILFATLCEQRGMIAAPGATHE